jgi:hypothetical protein
LSAWLLDLVRNGIAAVPGKGFEFFDSQARRMIDAQAPGVARRVRLLGSVAGGGAGWQRPFLEQMAILHLLTRATERLDELPEAVRADVEAALGITTSADELSGLPVTADRWQVIAQEVEVEDRLRIQRTWFYGVGSRRSAMVLQFAHGAATFDANLPVGRQFDGELVFFPGNGPRASVHRIGGSPEPLSSVNGCDSVEDLLGRFSHALAACPWIERLCWPLCRVIPSKIDEQWWLIDATDAALPMRLRDDVGFTLLAESGGRPVDIAAEYDGESLRPLSVVVDGRFLSLAAAMAEAA